MTWKAGFRGFKGGSSSPRQPVEAPDSLISTEFARIVDLISEGEIYGLVNGAQSILLDETPGSAFPSFSWDNRNGTQDQSYLAGFPAVESDIGIGVELQAGTPWVRAFSDLNLSAVRINFAVPRLLQQNASNGDTTGYRVAFAIDVAEAGGPFVQVLSSAFSGKTTGGYRRSVRVDLPGSPPGGWQIRVRRLTPNSTSGLIVDAVNIQSITEIIDAKFRYPNSAIVGMSFDAETFGGQVPRRGYHIRGRLIRVPSNYDPESREYVGTWDGTFQIAYSNNPAWVYYDLLLHPRFGLGDRITANQVDKWGLYEIGRYCDEFIDDGRGGLEPRFTCNLYLQQRADALKVLQDVAAVFRGITYWGAGQAIVSADLPKDPVYTYTNANVIGGKFSRKGSKRSTRYSVVLVSWNDPTDMYRAKVEYVQDDALVARFGVREIQLTAIGCTSQGQAQRAGRWALLTNQYETEMITFSTGLEGIRAMPGDVIKVADANRAGRRIGGRIRSATANSVDLDQIAGYSDGLLAGSETLLAGSEQWLAGSTNTPGSIVAGDEITVILPSGLAETRTISAVVGERTIEVSPAFTEIPVPMSIWAHETSELKTELYRITAISENPFVDGEMSFAVSATKYIPDKHGAVDFGTIISQRPVTSIPASTIAAPENILFETDWLIDQYAAVTTLTITWDPVPGAIRYDVEWKRNESDWVYAGRVATTEVDVVGVYAGEYMVRVRAINSLNILSPWATVGPVYLMGKTGLPPAPVGVTTSSEVMAIRVTWGVPLGAEDTAYSELQIGNVNDDPEPTTLGRFAYPTNTYRHSGMASAVVRWFRVRLIDKTGNIGPWSAWVYGISSANSTEILDYLTGQITETQLGSALLEQIESGGEAGAQIEELRQIVDDIDDGLSVMYGVKLGVTSDGVYYGAGMGIGIENTPEGMQSQVLFYADRFAFLNSTGPGASVVSPFVIQGGQTIINEAVIGEATISFAKIVDDVQSTDYVPNVSGWRLGRSGSLEFNAPVAGGGRLSLNNELLQVFDSAGTLRVRLGIWGT